MRVNASLPSYKQIEVELNPNKTAKDLKVIICKKLGIEPELTRLLAHGKPLPDHTRLSRIRETVTIDYLWARHLLLWCLEGQRRIRDSSVLLAGASAIVDAEAEHREILRLCEAREVTAAVTYLRRHILNAGKNLLLALGRDRTAAAA